MNKLLLTATVAAVALTTALPNAHATTVQTETVVQTQELENVNQINFSAFDINNDGLFAKSEVGEKLFYIFDQDGNEVIDNREWNDENIYTITPMEKETFRAVDYNNDGYTDLSTYTYETFYEESGLIRFDNDKNGLSAAEFINVGYKALDDNKSDGIEIDEWKEAYTASTSPSAANQDLYN